MSEKKSQNQVCVVIGASHSGVNFAFALRREGWEGAIMLFDADPMLPYHRPPLSKTFLTSEDNIEKYLLKSADSYQQEKIELFLGVRVISIDARHKTIKLEDDRIQAYDKLVLATGARALVPPIPGIDSSNRWYTLRTVQDVTDIRQAIHASESKRVVVIGGGYIGLEMAASLQKLGTQVVLLERENRVLARVTAPEMSQFYELLHTENGVEIYTGKQVNAIETQEDVGLVRCADGSRFIADLIVVGVGIQVNTALAEQAGLEVQNGILVDSQARTSDKAIYAIGDCTFHYNPHYDRFIRLESVQNAVDQAKVAAAAICGKEVTYDTLPWFWSDQFDTKLQMVGLSDGYTQALMRKEDTEGVKFSVWYFKEDTLLAVDAVNNAKAYVIGTKFIKSGEKIDKQKLIDPSITLKPVNLLVNSPLV